MSRVTLQTIDSAPELSRPYLENARRASGFIPNLLAALATSPAAIKTYVTVSDINNHSSLSAAEREVVQLIAATTHGCSFCVAGHSATVEKKHILPEAELENLRTRQPLADAQLNTLAWFTQLVIATRGAVSDEVYQQFLAAGFTQQQALDVILGVSLATLCNFANSLAKTPLNTELQPWAWSE